MYRLMFQSYCGDGELQRYFHTRNVQELNIYIYIYIFIFMDSIAFYSDCLQDKVQTHRIHRIPVTYPLFKPSL